MLNTYIDVVMQMYNLIKYRDNYSKKSESLRQYYRDQPYLPAENSIQSLTVAHNNSKLFKFRQKATGKTGNNGTIKMS